MAARRKRVAKDNEAAWSDQRVEELRQRFDAFLKDASELKEGDGVLSFTTDVEHTDEGFFIRVVEANTFDEEI